MLDPALLAMSFLVGAVATFILSWLGLFRIARRCPVREGLAQYLRNLFRLTRSVMGHYHAETSSPLFPTFMLLFLAGLQDVPDTLYEAAAIDGATPASAIF